MIPESIAKWFAEWVKKSGCELIETKKPSYTYVRKTPVPKFRFNNVISGDYDASEPDLHAQIKDAMVKKISQAMSRGETVKLTCDGKTLGFFTPGGFVDESHPSFKFLKE